MYRLKKMAHFARGKVLDIGFADQPNPYLQGEVYGFDRQRVPVPTNYDTVIVGDVNSLSRIDESFDTIVAGELIEHLDDPVGFLSDCYHLLNPGGRLILSTPNPDYPPVVWLERLMIRRFFYSEEHVFLFPPRFLVRLVERQGFRDVRVHSGGVLVPWIHVSVPFPRPFCYAIIYVGDKA